MSSSPERGRPQTGGEPGDRIAILGLGNELMGDDGFGPQVIRALKATYEFEPRVVLHDLGTPGLDLVPYVVAATGALIIVDTVHATGEPGEIRCYARADLLRTSPAPRMSPHDPGVGEALLAGELEGTTPEDVLLVGVIPESVEPGLGLSDAVAAAVGPAMDAVCEELNRLGVPATKRPAPLPVRSWWEPPR